MRTVIFFGLMCIADAIGARTEWSPSNWVAIIGAFILGGAIAMDVLEIIFFRRAWRHRALR